LGGGDFVDSDIWGEREVALFRFLGEVISSPTAGEEAFVEARRWFDDQQIVEILIAQVNRELQCS
jgi:hypothetical protein